MVSTPTRPLRPFAWAVLISVSAFIALFYLSFLSMSEREHELLHISVQQDSLLLSVFHMMRDLEGRILGPAEAEARMDVAWSAFDSLLDVHDISLSARAEETVGAFRGYGQSLLRDPSVADHGYRYDALLNVEQALGNHITELVAEENRDFQQSINVWAGLSMVIVAAGFWFTLWLASARTRELAAYNRLSSILQLTEDPIVIYDGEGRTVFTNPAFQNRFPAAGASDLRRADRFRYLDTPADGLRSETLWAGMMKGLASASAWNANVAITVSGREVHYSLYAIGKRDDRHELDEIIVTHSDRSDVNRLRAKAKEAEDQYRSIVENSPDALVLLQAEEVVYANTSARELFGFKKSEQISELRFAELFGPAGKLAFHVPMEARHVGDQILSNAEFRATTKEGKLIDVEASASVVRWGDLLALQATFRDITERKSLEREQALWAWEQDALSEIDRRLVGIVDLKTILSSIIQQVLNLSRAHWAGILMYDDTARNICWRAMGGNVRTESEDVQFEVTPAIRALLSGSEPLVVQELKGQQNLNTATLPGLSGEGIISSAWFPLKVEDRQEGVLAVGFRSYHTFAEREMRLLVSLAEKTAIALANASLYENLLQREQELEVLSGARVDAQEAERRRIAREIHDGLGQILTAIKLNVEIMEDAPSVREEDRKKFDDVKGLLDSVMKEARQISYDLMPSVLEDFGLVPALQLLSEKFGEQSRVRVQFFSKGDIGRISQRKEIALYRIVQEALTNSVRHGEATQITLQVSLSDHILRLTIEDNGKGMEEAMQRMRRAQGGGIGLASMRERVNSFNGTLSIDSAPGKGTLIIVELPMEGTIEQAQT